MQEIQNNKKHTKLKWLSIVFTIAVVAAIVITSSVIGFQKHAINSERDFRKTQQKIQNNIENSLQMIA